MPLSKNEIRDKAYLIATANSLCETLSYDQFQKVSDEDLMSIVWEPFENWDANKLYNHITQIADSVIYEFSE